MGTQATQAGVSVQRGIQATMHYNYQYNGITWQQIKTATEDYIATQHGEQKSHSESAFANGHAGVNGFWSFLGFNVGASGGWNSASSSNTVSGEQAAHLHSLFSNIGSSAKQDITLTGDITAVGQSYIPTEGFVFVRVISFHFDDGRTFTAVDTSGAPNSAIAATSNGDTSSLTTTSAPPAQINIVPASRQLLLGERAQLRLLGNQDASLSTVRIERGYTQATQAGVSVQRGIQATMHYNYQYNGITWQQIKTATEDYIATQHGEQKSHSESAFVNGHAGVNGFWSFLGFNVGASGGWNSASSSNTVSGE